MSTPEFNGIAPPTDAELEHLASNVEVCKERRREALTSVRDAQARLEEYVSKNPEAIPGGRYRFEQLEIVVEPGKTKVTVRPAATEDEE